MLDTGLDAKPLGDRRERKTLAHARKRLALTDNTVLAVVVAAAVGVGLYGRLWLIFHTPYPSDPSIAGLIAQGGLHGHFLAFYGGQVYGGTAEDYIVGLAFLLFGQSGVVAGLVMMGFTAVAAVLTYCIAAKFVPRRLAVLAGALMWAAPAVTVRDSIREYGFRGVVLICGLVILLLALRIDNGGRLLPDLPLLGFLLGIGWWSSPEIAYFALPTALLLGHAIIRQWNVRTWLPALASAVLLLGLGSLPWIWANAQSGLASIRPGSSSGTVYLDRLGIFFHYSLPMETGLLRADDGMRILHSMYWPSFVLVAVVLIVTLGFCFIRGWHGTVIGLTVVAFPFLYAIAPTSWEWGDGRYNCYFVPLMALILVIGVDEGGRRLSLRADLATAAMAALVLCSVVLSVVGLLQVIHLERTNFTSYWGDPDDATIHAISELERSGVSTGYADYWVAYRLDFLGRGRLNITTAGFDDDRSPTINEAVALSHDPAWLFVPASEALSDGNQFLANPLTRGPDAGAVTEGRFTASLHRLGIHYRIVDLGILEAVIPDTAVRPYQVGAPGAIAPNS